MSIESAADWAGLAAAAAVTRATLDALEQRVRPDITTAALDSVAAGICAAHGARSAPQLEYGLTIEPMISAGSSRPIQDPDGWTIRTSDGSLAAHWEHTLVITAGGPTVLTRLRQGRVAKRRDESAPVCAARKRAARGGQAGGE